MAVVYQTEEEEKKKVGEGAGQGLQTQGNLLGEEPEKNLTTGGGEGSMVQGSGGSAQRQGGRSASGSYTNLQAYLDANKNDDMSGRIAGAIQGEVDQAKQAQATAGQGFRQRVDEARVGTDQTLLDRIKSDARGVVGSEADKTAFEKMRDAQYKGPSQLSETEDLFNPAYKESKEAKEQLDAMNSLEGRKAYLKQQSGPRYSKGMAKLDNLILQNDPKARESFKSLQEQNTGFESAYDKLLAELGDYAGAAKSETEATRSGALDALSQGIKAQQDKTSGRLTDRLKEIDLADSYKKSLSSRDLSSIGRDKAQELFGFDPATQAAFGLDAGSYLNSVNRDLLTQDTVRNQEEADVLRALGELGGDVSGVNFEGAGLFDDESLWSFNKEGYRGDLSGRESALNKTIEGDASIRGYSDTARQADAYVEQANQMKKTAQNELDTFDNETNAKIASLRKSGVPEMFINMYLDSRREPRKSLLQRRAKANNDAEDLIKQWLPKKNQASQAIADTKSRHRSNFGADQRFTF